MSICVAGALVTGCGDSAAAPPDAGADAGTDGGGPAPCVDAAACVTTDAGPATPVLCVITRPAPATYLNASDDDSPSMPGFQGSFEVATDARGAGQPIRLIIDGDSLGAPTSSSGAFAVTLSEGTHRFRGECRDASGNPTLSDEASWTVDTEACVVALMGPHDPLTPADDADPSTPELDVDLILMATGTGCAEYRVASCSGIIAAAFMPLVGTSARSRVTLPTGGAIGEVCGEVRDTAGNVGQDRLLFVLRADAPQVRISDPPSGTSYSAAGDATHRADLDSTTPACDAAFTVLCTDVGTPVTLHLEGDATPLAASADCVADASAPAPFRGRALFPSVALPSDASGAPLSVVASQTAAGLTGDSASVSLTANCQVP